jgi:DNA repair exonuclease SbcCD ATPase subunit
METQSVVDYIKTKYPKVVFTPFKFAYSNALGFILNNDKLIIGFVNKNGNLCKLVEPLDLSNITNEDIETVIKKIPIVTGFSEQDREKLLGLFENTDKKGRVAQEKLIKGLQKELEDSKSKQAEYKVLYDGESNKVITIKSKYEEQIAKIKSDYDEKSKQLEQCSKQLVNEKYKIVEGINKYKDEMNDFIKSKDFKIEELEKIHNKLTKEKEELESKLNGTINVIEAKNKASQEQIIVIGNEKDAIILEKEGLIKNIKQLEKDVKMQKDAIEKLTVQKQELEKQIQQISQSKDEISELSSQLSQSKSEISDLSSQLSLSKSEASDLTSQLSLSKSEASDLRSQLSQSKSEVSDLSSQLSLSRSEASNLNSQLSQSKSELEQLRQTKSELSELKKNYEEELAKNIEVINNMEAELNKKREEYNALEEKTNEELETKNKKIRELENGKKMQANEELSQIISNMEAELKNKTEEYNVEMNNKKQLESEFENKTQIISNIEAKLKKKTGEYSVLESEIAKKSQAISDVEAQLQKRNEEYSVLESELEKKNQTISEMEMEIKRKTEAEQKILDIESSLNTKTQILTDTESELEKSKYDVEEINKTLQEKEQDIDSKNQEIVQLKNVIDEIKQELKKLQDELSKTEMAKKMEDGMRDRCKEKILKEKEQIIDAIKEYNEKWTEWVGNVNTDFEKYKQKMISELQQVQANLQKTLNNTALESDDKTRLKQNIRDIELQLNKTIAEHLVQINAKDEEIRLAKESQNVYEKLEFQVQEKDKQLSNAGKEIEELKKELEKVRALLAQNNQTAVQESLDYDNCYNILQNFSALNNIFFRKQEIIKKLDEIIGKNIDVFSQLTEAKKSNIESSFKKVKAEIERHIKFLDLSKYINNPNFQLLKNKSTWKKVSPDFCPELTNLLEYWNQNKLEYREQDKILTNIYEDLSGAVRVYVRIKPLTELNEKTVTIKTIDNKKQKMVVLDCSNNVKKEFGEFYGIFDENYTNQDVFSGSESTMVNSDSLKIDMDAIIETADTVSPGLYSSFKQVEDGYSIVLFGYGASGAGKSFSLLGNSGIPGLLQYGLANLHDVSNIKMKYLFEQYYSAVDVNFGKVRGKIHNLIREVPQMREYSKNETQQFANIIPQGIDINNLRIEDITRLLDVIEKYRITNLRIKKTPNNPVSSRSHMFLVFEVGFESGKTGYITIVDTAGRESPLDIYNIFIDTSQVKLATLMAPGPVGGEGTVARTMRKDLDPVYTSQHIFQVLKEGFYINETINHIIYYFNKKNYKQTKVMLQSSDPEKYSVSKYYVNPINEEQAINTANNCLTIPIMKFLDNLSNRNKSDVDFRPTKFIMINHVRQEQRYCNQTLETLQFAQMVKST